MTSLPLPAGILSDGRGPLSEAAAAVLRGDVAALLELRPRSQFARIPHPSPFPSPSLDPAEQVAG